MVPHGAYTNIFAVTRSRTSPIRAGRIVGGIPRDVQRTSLWSRKALGESAEGGGGKAPV